MNITWKEGRVLPTFVKGGAMGMVDGVPVYAAGCTYPWRETELSWYWDEARGDWFPVEPNLPLGRAYTQGVTLHDGLLLLGGRKTTPDGRISLRDAWWLRRHDGRFYWTQLPDMNYPRAVPMIGVLGNKVLAVGGGEWERSQGGAFATRHLTHYEILDLDNLAQGWQDMGPLPFAPVVNSGFASIGRSFYFFGGYECWTENNTRRLKYSQRAWRYDLDKDAWTQLADFPCPSQSWSAAACENTIFLIGGIQFANVLGAEWGNTTTSYVEKGTSRQRPVGTYSPFVFAYDIPSNSYRLLEERLPFAAADTRCTVAGHTIYLAGGETNDPALSNTINAFLIGSIFSQ